MSSVENDKGSNTAEMQALRPDEERLLAETLKTQAQNLHPDAEQWTVRLDGVLKTAIFAKAWNELIARKDVLRTVYKWKNIYKPFKTVLKMVSITIDQQDFAQAADQEEQVKLETKVQTAERTKSFDLEKGPLFRVMLYRLGPDEYTLLVTSQPLIASFWQDGVFVQELLELYHTLAADEGEANALQADNFKLVSKKIATEEVYYPVSAAERRMYILYQLETESIQYNIPQVLKVRGRIDHERFFAVLKALIARHEAFRTSYKVVDGEPMQQVHSEVDFTLGYQKVTNKTEFEEALRNFIRPFDLGQAPLVRAGFVEYAGEVYFVMDVHHIIADGFSMGIFVVEFQKLYAGETLPELKAQYKDYRKWQDYFLRSDRFRKEEAFWLAMYEDEIPVLNLPLDYPRGAVRGLEGDTVVFRLDRETVTRLRQFAARQKMTPYMVLFAVYNLLLARYSGQDDIVVGTAVAGRAHPFFESVVGMFVNTLAIRTRLTPNDSFEQYAQKVKDVLLKVFAHQNYPFDILIDKLDVEIDVSRNPMFDAFFSLQGADLQSTFTGLSFELYQFHSGVAKFDFSLDGTLFNGEIEFALEYGKRLFTREKVEQFTRHFMNAVSDVLAYPEKKLREIEILSGAEKLQVVQGFNNLTVAYPEDQLLHQLFEAQVRRAPERIALKFQDQELTYGEVNVRANQLAWHLRKKGVGPEKIVGMLLEPSLEQIIGMLAILKAGGAYLPIDRANPVERIKQILDDSQPELLLIRGAVGFAYEDIYTGEMIDLTLESLYTGSQENLPVITGPENLAYIIYTSGSTGQPKGVMIEHRNVVAYSSSFLHEFRFTADDVITHVASYSFDASVDEIFHMLSVGGCVVVIEKEELLNVRKLAETIERQKVTVFSSTPLFLNEFNKLEPVPTLHTILSGGDLLKAEYISNLVKYAQVYNVYGPTETTVCATFYRCGVGLEGNVSIGKPIANYQIYILDKTGKPVPVGVEGEMFIAGVGVARGYLHHPELTGEKFVPNPLLPGTRMYRTGDLGKWLPDGNIEFCGRADHQIKIRGFRIEPGEIEHKLVACPGVHDAIVIERHDGGEPYLCAYVVPEKMVPKDAGLNPANAGASAAEADTVGSGGLNAGDAGLSGRKGLQTGKTGLSGSKGLQTGEAGLSISELRSHLSQVVPDYMVPARFVLLDEIPYTSVGKVDRKRLPVPDDEDTGVEFIAPANETEEKLAAIWMELLGVARVSRTDNFFALGGHSLKATALVLQIYQVFRVEVQLRQVFQAATLAELAEIIAGGTRGKERVIPPVEVRDFYPASSAQKRQFILNQYEGIQITYNLPGLFIVEGELDCRRFEAAMQKLVQRHEALRTYFEMLNGEIVQRISADLTLPVSYLKVSEEELPAVAADFIQPFDLGSAPLCRVGLISTEKRNCLVMDMHHIISDAVSTNILIYDFVALYQGMELEPLTIQYKDYAVWQNEFFASGELKRLEQYWLDIFSEEVPVLNLPTDYPRPTVQSFLGDRLFFELEPELWQKLQTMLQKRGVTLYMALLAAYTVLLQKYTGQEDIVVGSPIAGRDYPGLEKILGMFVNTLALRNRPVGTKTFARYLSEVKENALRAYENQDYPFEMLIEQLDVQRDLSRNPLFDTVLVVQNAGEGEMAIPGLTFIPYQLESKVSRFDMTWTVAEGDTLYGSVEYCTKLFRRETVQQMVGHLLNILREVTANPELPLRDIDILAPAEREALLSELNNSLAGYPTEKTVQQLFQEQVQRTPDRVALKFGDETMTYRELNAQANRLARVLRAKGVGRDQIVGMLLPRSLEMLVGIFAIIKAGGAYLPMDPDYPLDRIEYMLADSGAPVLLTDKPEGPEGYNGIVLNLWDLACYRQSALQPAYGAGRGSGTVLAGKLPGTGDRVWLAKDAEKVADAEGIGSAAHQLDFLSQRIDLTVTNKGKGISTDGEIEFEEFIIDEFSMEDAPALEPALAETEAVRDSAGIQEWADDLLDDSNLDNLNRPQDLLYIIYTSGSTGKPKGVMIEHRNLVRLMFNDKMQFDFTENDVWTMFHSYCFDFSVWEMYGALLYGGKLIIVPKIVAQNPAEFLELLRREQVTVLNQTPTAFYKLSEEEMQVETCDLAVRYIIYGGEALKPLKLREWHSKYPAARLINMYGITETTVHVTYKEITMAEISAGVSNIGKPIPTLTTYVLNRDLQLVPKGVPGELCVGGEGLARGYLNRPELTAEKFVQHPYRPHERLYRSGDLGRLLPNGEVEYLGRIDHQVKIRGFRIELGEIESQLLQHEAIKESVVLDYKDAEGQSYLAAYLVSEREVPGAELRNFLKIGLPDYMIPAHFIRLTQLPLTSNGKLDRRALPQPEEHLSGRAYVAPATDTEAKVAAIWQEVLGVEQVSREDDFFELGGHSLKATALVQKVRKELNVEISLKEIFKTSILKELALLIDRAQHSQFSGLEPVEEREYYPVSAAQKRIYLYHEIRGANIVYNIPSAFLMTGNFDPARFKMALEKVLQRHEALRTSFKKVGDEVVQVIWPQVDLTINQLWGNEDLPTVGANEHNPELDNYLRQFIQPFDLLEAPLLRVGLGKLSDGYLLAFDMHHSISDGTSMNILVGDFLKAYAGEDLPGLRLQYKDFAIWQNQLFTSEAFRAQEEYWLNMFADGVPELHLPLDYERPEIPTSEGDVVRFNLDWQYAVKLQELAQGQGATLFMVLLAAYNILLAKYSGQEELVVGTPIAGRTHPDLEEIIGMFVNTLALKTHPAGNKTFLSYLAEVREITLKAFENQDYQFEMLVDKLGLHLAQNRTPLFDVLLVVQNMRTRQTEVGELEAAPYWLNAKTAKFDLALYVEEENGLSFNLDYRARLFKRETVELFAERLVQLLIEIVDAPEREIASLCSAMSVSDAVDLSGFLDDLDDEF